MEDCLKVIMPMEKKMQLGLVGGITIEQKKRCKGTIEMDKWLTNGFFTINVET